MQFCINSCHMLNCPGNPKCKIQFRFTEIPDCPTCCVGSIHPASTHGLVHATSPPIFSASLSRSANPSSPFIPRPPETIILAVSRWTSFPLFPATSVIDQILSFFLQTFLDIHITSHLVCLPCILLFPSLLVRIVITDVKDGLITSLPYFSIELPVLWW